MPRLDRPLRGLLAVALVVTALVGTGAAVPGERVLVVEDADTGDRLATVPVEAGTVVNLSYTHSVEKTPVHDIYTVRGGTLDNTEMRFKSYGWGLPAREEVRQVGGYFVFDPDRSYEEFYVKAGRVAGHRLTVGDRRIDLVALSNASSVRIAVERRSALATAISKL